MQGFHALQAQEPKEPFPDNPSFNRLASYTDYAGPNSCTEFKAGQALVYPGTVEAERHLAQSDLLFLWTCFSNPVPHEPRCRSEAGKERGK